uniref:Uncharacterized protein n=1 Tax=Roseihalotalea indica TaxID=2867963 RepID=A0AA49JCL7_9BACT|nr:hypothetical protein K4G66_25705 [Tunicatimonas sp. TK19036]
MMRKTTILLLFFPLALLAQQEAPFKNANQVIVLSHGSANELTVQALRTLAQESYEITYSDKEVGIINANTSITSYANLLLTITAQEGKLILTGKLYGEVWGDGVKMDVEVKGRSDNRTKAFSEMQRIGNLLGGYQTLYAEK